MSTIQECITFANENPMCSLATVENEQPRVRLMGFWFADETGFYFQIGFNKEMFGQLKENSKTEVCFYEFANQIGNMLRISGEIEFVDTPELREKVFIDRPFLKSFGLTIDSPNIIMFRIAHGKANLWTPEMNLQPKVYIEF